MKFRTFIALLLAAPAVFAGPINSSDEKAINGNGSNGRHYVFNLDGLSALSGTGGQLTFTLNGDFSFQDAAEYAIFDLEGSGNITLGGGYDLTGIPSFASTVAGLTFVSHSMTGTGNDVNRVWVFDLSNQLLSALVDNNKLQISADSPAAVEGPQGNNQDFIRVGLSYQGANGSGTPAADVPEPASLALSGLGLGLLALARRRRKSA